MNLYIKKNIVFFKKEDNPDYPDFIKQYLTKYEDVTTVDLIESFGSRKKYKTIKELRNLYTETDEYVFFSRGLLTIIPQNSYTIISQDAEEINVTNIDLSEIEHILNTFDLRKDQVLAVRKCLFNKRGIIQMPTATGKSAIITAVIKYLLKIKPDIKCLALSPTLSTADGLNNTFLENNLNSHLFAHPDSTINQGVNVALVQSLISYASKDPDFLESIDAVFYDECLPQGALILLPDYSEKTMLEIYEDNSIDTVLSYNLETNTYEPKKILKKIRTYYNQKFWRVKYYNPIDQQEYSVPITGNHKIYVKDKGYIKVSDLKVDDLIRYDNYFLRDTKISEHLFAKVTNIHKGIGKIAKYKYNIEVEDNHNYFANSILVSNCHHLKCETWNQLNILVRNAEYSLGFSALTIDDNEVLCDDITKLSYESAKIIGSTGRVLMHMKPAYYIEHHIIATPVLFRVYNKIELPANDSYDYQKAIKFGIKSKQRTELASRIAEIFNKYNYKILILVSEKSHGFELGKELVKQGIYNYGISYGAGKGYIYASSRPVKKQGNIDYSVNYTEKNSIDVINDFNDNKIPIMIGTSHIDEGVDVQNLDAVILVSSGKKDRRIIQRVGRALRKSKTGKYAYIIDFTDSGDNILSKHSMDRLSIYKDIIGVPSTLIFDNLQPDSVETIFKTLEQL